MLIFPLTSHWFGKIKSGEKDTEFRLGKQYWTTRLINNFVKYCQNPKDELLTDILDFSESDDWLGVEETWIDSCKQGLDVFIPCILQLGYTKTRLEAVIDKIEWLPSGKDTDLHIDKPVYAIHLKDVREC